MEPVKVIVAGPARAGKSTLIRALADLTVRTTDEAGATFELGRITLGRDLVLYLHGVPNEHDPAASAQDKNVLGFIVVVDATNERGVAEGYAYVHDFQDQDVPVFVAANRAAPGDVPNLGSVFGMPEPRVVALDCNDRGHVRDLVLAVLEEALVASYPTAMTMEIQARLG